MLAHSQHIPRAETQPGDFAVFGLNPSRHVVVVAEPITFLRLMPGGAVPPQGNSNPYCPLDVDGDFGPDTTMALQWKLGVAQGPPRVAYAAVAGGFFVYARRITRLTESGWHR